MKNVSELIFFRGKILVSLRVNENLRHVLPLLYCIVLFAGNWLGTVHVELLLSLSAFLGRNYRLRKKKNKKAPIATFLKTQL